MKSDAALAPGTKVETGEAGTPGYKIGVVVGVGSAELLGRKEDDSSALIAWESGEEEWAELGTLRVKK